MMMKPHEYCNCSIIRQDVHYEASDDQKGTHASTGTLHVGRVVWVKPSPLELAGSCVQAYVEGVGIVSIDPQALDQASS